MLATIISGAVLGVDAYLVRVEVDLGRGLPCIKNGWALATRCARMTVVSYQRDGLKVRCDDPAPVIGERVFAVVCRE